MIMGRWRPPAQKASPYITPQGEARLREELGYLWKHKRPEVTQALSAAAAEGDRSENAEYIYRKKELREIDRRIRYLQKRLDELVVVDRRPQSDDQVFFGAWVTCEDERGAEHTWRIVGADETDADQGWISVDSPVARALLKKNLDDEVIVRRPQDTARFTIVAIRYTPLS